VFLYLTHIFIFIYVKKIIFKNRLYRIYSYTTIAKDAIGQTLKALIRKDVQQAYSAYGRKVNGIGKHNFSTTNTFMCLHSEFFVIAAD